MTTPVIFRLEPRSKGDESDVTAVFPTIPGTDEYDMTCYAHIGQHGACNKLWFRTTTPASPEQYASLLEELQQIYEGDLVVCQRITSGHDNARREAMREMADAK